MDLYCHKNPEHVRNFTDMNGRQVYMGAPPCPFLRRKWEKEGRICSFERKGQWKREWDGKKFLFSIL